MEIISDSKVPMRIQQTGKVIWSPFGIYKVTCQSDITYYPLDKQTCTITLSSWAYTTSEVNLYLSDTTMGLNFYTENGEWEIVSTEGKQAGSVARGGISFSALEFSLTMRRRLLFHVLNTLFPVALMAFLIPMVFKLHVDSGEKVGYALTVLLAYAVYLSMISDSIPSTSVSVCFLAVYLVFVLAMGTFSVFCTLLIIDINQRSCEMTPRWKWWIRDVIGRIICEDCRGCCSKNKVGSTQSKHGDIIELTPVEEVDDAEYTWQDASYTLDKFFFDLFMLIIVLSTLVYSIMIFSQYK